MVAIVNFIILKKKNVKFVKIILVSEFKFSAIFATVYYFIHHGRRRVKHNILPVKLKTQ